MNEMQNYAVIYCAAGCMPDSDYPEFVGTLSECERWIDRNAHTYRRPEVTHDTYGLEIIVWDDDVDMADTIYMWSRTTL